MSSKAGSRQQAMIRHMMKTIQDNVKAGRRQHYYDNVKAGRRQHYYDNDRHMKSFLVGDVPFAMQKCASPYMHSAAQSTLWSDSSSDRVSRCSDVERPLMCLRRTSMESISTRVSITVSSRHNMSSPDGLRAASIA